MALVMSVGLLGPVPAFFVWTIPAAILYALTWRRATPWPHRGRAFAAGVGVWVAILLLCALVLSWLPTWGGLAVWLATVGFVVSMTAMMVRLLREMPSAPDDAT
jgi:hypothetical protein